MNTAGSILDFVLPWDAKASAKNDTMKYSTKLCGTEQASNYRRCREFRREYGARYLHRAASLWSGVRRRRKIMYNWSLFHPISSSKLFGTSSELWAFFTGAGVGFSSLQGRCRFCWKIASLSFCCSQENASAEISNSTCEGGIAVTFKLRRQKENAMIMWEPPFPKFRNLRSMSSFPRTALCLLQ